MPTYNTAFKNAFIDRETSSIEGQKVQVRTAADALLGESTVAADFFETAGTTTDGEAEGTAAFTIAITVAGTATIVRVFTAVDAYVDFAVVLAPATGEIVFPKVALNIGDTVSFDLFKLVFQV